MLLNSLQFFASDGRTIPHTVAKKFNHAESQCPKTCPTKADQHGIWNQAREDLLRQQQLVLAQQYGPPVGPPLPS